MKMSPTSRFVKIFLATCLTIASAPSFSQSIHPGQTLIKEANCMRCHAEMSFHSGFTKMESLSDLTRQVKLCDANLKVGWFDDEIEEVVDYLNQKFYRLSQ